MLMFNRKAILIASLGYSNGNKKRANWSVKMIAVEVLRMFNPLVDLKFAVDLIHTFSLLSKIKNFF